MKKILSAVLALALIVSMFTVFAVSASAAEPASYTGSALSGYRNELLNAKFGDWAWLDPYNNRSYPGYDSTIWGFICDDVDKIDAIKNSQVWNGTQYHNWDSEGRAAIKLMNMHIASISAAPATYTGTPLKTIRNTLLCALFGGDVADYTTWVWLTPYTNRSYPGYASALWGYVCDDIDWIDANRGSCTDAQGRAAIATMNTHLTALLGETEPAEDAILDSSSPYYAAALAGYNTLIGTGAAYNQDAAGPAYGNTTSSAYLAYFYNYYYGKITLPKYQAYTEVVAFKTLLDKVYVWLYGSTQGSSTLTGNVYYGLTNIGDKLQASWNTARANVPVAAGWNNLRKLLMDGWFPGGWNNPIGVDKNGNLCYKYTIISWDYFWEAVCWGDTHKNSCTDAEGEAALNDITTRYYALVLNPDYVGPVKEANYKAYTFCTQSVAGMPLYAIYVDRAYNRFLTPEIWEDASKVQPFLDKAAEADALFIEPYNDNIDYTAWVVFDTNGNIVDMILEDLWTTARYYAWIGPVLVIKADAISASVGSAANYTAESYALWQSLWSDLYTAVVDTKNSTTATDQDGYDIIQECIATLEYLEVNPTANATYNYYARQVAKLGAVSCDFIDQFNALPVNGTAAAFDAAVKALAPAFNTARDTLLFGTGFQKAVAKLAVKYAADTTVSALCTAAEVTRLANYGTVAECNAYLAQINTAIANVDAETAAKIAAKDACFGNSDRGTFVVNYKTAYNGYKALVTLPANQGTAYNNYVALLDEYNAAFASGELLTVAEYEAMRTQLEQAWWSMRKAAGLGRIFQAAIAKAAVSQAQIDYVANIPVAFYSTGTDAQIADVWTAFYALA